MGPFRPQPVGPEQRPRLGRQQCLRACGLVLELDAVRRREPVAGDLLQQRAELEVQVVDVRLREGDDVLDRPQ